jgi:transcription-repair coupling factor (superfamily II helicase)
MPPFARLAKDLLVAVANDLLATAAQTPAVQSLQRRLEEGSVFSCGGVSQPAQPFLSALLRRLFPQRPLVIVTSGLKTQEGFHQDITTWLQFAGSGRVAGEQSGDHRPQPPTGKPLFYPAWETLPHEAKLPHADVISERLEALIALAQNGQRDPQPPPLMITSVTALLQRTFSPDELRRRTRVLSRGDPLDPIDLVEWLEEQGYEPEAQVTQKGEIALRGGILDVYPPTSPWPVRLEFFGAELESFRYFDPLTQISREEITSVPLPPAGELGIFKRQFLSPLISASSSATEATGEERQTTDQPGRLSTLIDYLPAGTIFVLCEPDALTEHARQYAEQVPDGDPYFISWQEFQAALVTQGMTALRVDEMANGEVKYLDPDLPDATARLADSGQSPTPSGPHPQPALLSITSLDAYRPLGDGAPEPQVAEVQRREFFVQLNRWLRQGCSVHVFCNNDGERQRFNEIWEEYGLGTLGPPSRGSRAPQDPSSRKMRSQKRPVAESKSQRDGWPTLHIGALSRGFFFEAAKLAVVTDAEIFGRYKVQRPRRLKSPHAVAMRSALAIDFGELEEGDYVVHLQHGIGRYLGLKVLPMGAGRKRDARAADTIGVPSASALRGNEPSPDSTLRGKPGSTGTDALPPLAGAVAESKNRANDPSSSSADEGRGEGQECLVIEYAPSDPTQPPPKLYVPVTEAHLVSKYIGAGKARPPLNTLGGARWAKAKAQAEKAVRDLAGELLSIQAARESQPGHAFTPDTPWQREFESSFIYEETPDQLRAISETKADMEKPKPLDRLICGDVGFGKTEVAIRAAFKAVMGGRQVAVLVPTTVLAQQHFNTFRERMADYPVSIELLSRFRTRGQQQRVINDLESGSVDIVIGTHRFVQDDVKFKDLGLVIIDEEQRFGVMQKEKFKLLRKLVDVLTLSATPIPRTLYLALTGARDMSTIETPPQDRLPVETIVTQYDERVIRDAIQRELNRGGQVFFLHNRVLTIETMAQKLKALLPQARLVVGHGQMHSDDLEEVMTRFVNGEADVLLSTTIIESGLDIPNANTIIIDRADRFGLSDLYQLRGRVGRYKHQAYAYLLLPRHAGLLTDARKRISAIKQYSTLGSGFKVAMRDLEIRGAGNLLGPEQSGHITAVGFELYCQLLKQSVSALKGEKVKPRVDVHVTLDFLALGPEEGQPVIAGATEHAPRTTDHGAAYIPLNYIPDPRQRIDIYRKLAQATDKPALKQLRDEMRDRFGPLAAPLELLLQVAELKILAADRGVTAVESREDKLMLSRNGDYVTLGGKFPRFTRREPKAKLNEIKKLLLSL